MSEPEGHDGVRRWAIHYSTGLGNATFYSDALTMSGAQAHFERSNPDIQGGSHIRRVKPDEWLNRP